MGGLSRRLQVFERDWLIDDEALTLAEREADFRIMLRAVRAEYEHQERADPGLQFIVDVLRVEGDNTDQEQADEALLDAWAQRHGWSEDQIARNRAGRPARTRAWIEKLTRGIWPVSEPHARTFWGSMTW